MPLVALAEMPPPSPYPFYLNGLSGPTDSDIESMKLAMRKSVVLYKPNTDGFSHVYDYIVKQNSPNVSASDLKAAKNALVTLDFSSEENRHEIYDRLADLLDMLKSKPASASWWAKIVPAQSTPSGFSNKATGLAFYGAVAVGALALFYWWRKE